MNTILCSCQKSLYTANPSSIRNQPLVHHHPASSSLLKVSWKLNAQPKGFGTKQEDENPSKLSTRKQAPAPTEDDDDEIPQVVFERMTRRILASVGVPLAVGVVVLKTLDLLKENHVLEVPLWVPFVTTFLTFGSSVLGIAYGSLSTSWDPEKEGSFLGLENATQNWTELWKEDGANNK